MLVKGVQVVLLFLPLGLWGRRGFVVACVCPSICELYLVRTITRHIFGLESPNLHQTCILGHSRLVLRNRGHWPWPSRSFWPFWLRILWNSACPRNNSSQIWDGIAKFASNMRLGMLLSGIENKAHWPWPSRSFWPFWLRISQIWTRITKFARNMHPRIRSAGIENRGHLPWPSRSCWPFWLRILGNSVCPRNKSSQIWAGITKFSPYMHHGIVLSGIENRGHWPWPSRSFWPFWLRISQIWTRITKFAPNMHLEILLTGIAYGGH